MGIIEAAIAALVSLGMEAGAAATAAEVIAPVIAGTVEAGGVSVEAAAATAAAAHIASVESAAGAVGLIPAAGAASTAAGAVKTGVDVAKNVAKKGKGILDLVPGQSLGGKAFNSFNTLGGVLFTYDMIKGHIASDPEFQQQLANGDEDAINQLQQMMQAASQNSNAGTTQDQYNAIKGNQRVDTIKSYLGANAPGSEKGILGNRNDLQHLISGQQDMLGQVGRQEPMSMLEAYARQGIVPPQGYR